MRLVYTKQRKPNLKFSKVKLLIFTTAGFFLTLFGIKFFLIWSKKNQILDIPNERSSHRKPTPVGGGIVFVSVSLLLFLIYLISAEKEIPWSYFGGAVLIAAVSWLDDLYSIPAVVRFFFHSLAALLVIVGLGVFDNIYLPVIGALQIGNFVYGLWFLWIVWLINAYNFMDGIDGIAGIQAVSAALAWAFLGYLQGIEEVFLFGLLTAFSIFGFLLYNWQPAKIFMGDVGSAFLGYTFAVFPLFFAGKTGDDSGSFLIVSVLFVWLFVFDTVRTFFVRLIKGETVWKAHRRHLYQRLVIRGFSHQFVTILYGTLSVLISILTIMRLYFGVLNDLFLYFMVGLVSAGLLIFVFYGGKHPLEN
jgi:UDP-N-acetylmuramyl pentapeptide phosphotransferase/UDP-N-acetylglucosamine-1-phosphate transferase